MNMLSSIDVPIEIEAPTRRTAARPRWRRHAALVAPLLLLGAVGAKLIDRPDAVAAVATPPHVTVAAPLVRPISESRDYVGRFSPSRTAEVRPGVAGEVTGIHVREGEIVSKGQLLFTVDPRTRGAAATQVRAPMAGRIAARHVEAGSRVVGGRTLARIDALDPILFAFDAPDSSALKGRAAVDVQTEDSDSHRWMGRFTPTANGGGRAVLPNKDYALQPGMVGHIRLAAAGSHPALLVPQEAVHSERGRQTVLALDAQDRVVERPVTLGPVVEGLRVVRTGLTAGDRIVVQGMTVALPGFKVAPRTSRIEIADATEARSAAQ